VGPAKKNTPIGRDGSVSPRLEHRHPVHQTLDRLRLAHHALLEEGAQPRGVEAFAIVQHAARQTGELGKRGEQRVARELAIRCVALQQAGARLAQEIQQVARLRAVAQVIARELRRLTQRAVVGLYAAACEVAFDRRRTQLDGLVRGKRLQHQTA
jgi:hypothetical protein